MTDYFEWLEFGEKGCIMHNVKYCFDNSNFGYEIERKKGLFTHTGVIIGYIKYGELLIFHNHPDSGPTIVTYSEFCDGYQASYTKREPNTNRNQVLSRMNQLLKSGRSYHGLAFNCHQASSYVISGIEKSEPVEVLKWTAGITALSLIATVIISESNKPKRRKLR